MPEVVINAEFTQTRKVSKYSYLVVNVEPYSSASIVIILIDENDQEIYSFTKFLQGEDYNAWGNDDTYLVNIVDEEVKKIVSLIDTTI